MAGLQRVLPILFCLFLFFSAAFSPAHATAPVPSKRCVVLVINGLTLDEITADKMPRLVRASRQMSIGLLNLKTNGGYNPEKILLGLSAGAPVQANNDGDPFLSVHETYNKFPAKILYKRFWGHSETGGVFNPFYASLSLQNVNTEFINEIGHIGSTLHQRGGKTGYWGGSDPEATVPIRSAGLIAADAMGRIDFGATGDTIRVSDPANPSGRRLDRTKIMASFLPQADRVDLAVFDWGDLAVIDYWSSYLPAYRYHVLRKEGLLRFDRFFGALFGYCLKTHRPLVVFSISVSKIPDVQQRLGWAMTLNGETDSHGLLTSATTRQPGLISTYDIHIWLDSKLGIRPPVSAIGAPLQTVKGDLATLVRLNSDLNNLENQRTPILIILIYGFAIVIILSAFFALYGRLSDRAFHRFEPIVWVMALLPLAFLLTALFKPSSIPIHLLLGLILAGLFWSVIQHGWKSTADRIKAVCLLTVLGLLGDALTNGTLSAGSVFGYSLTNGARYYGLGNEYTGVLVGSSLLGAGLFLEGSKGKRINILLTGLALTVIPMVVGFPLFGANFGDIVPLIPVIGITLMLFSNHRLTAKSLIPVLSVLAMVIVLFALYDLRQENPTHLGRLVRDIINNGWQVLGLLIQRKLEMNWKLVQYSRWTTLVIIVLIIFPLALFNPRGPLRRVFGRHSHLRSAYIGISLAAIGGFVFNDSGIVAAATTLLIPSLFMLLLMIESNGLSP